MKVNMLATGRGGAGKESATARGQSASFNSPRHFVPRDEEDLFFIEYLYYRVSVRSVERFVFDNVDDFYNWAEIYEQLVARALYPKEAL